MSFPKHKEYKCSGLDWFARVPSHWEVSRFPYAIHFQEGPGIMASDFYDVGVPLIRVSGVQDRWVTLEGCNHLSPEKVAETWDHFRLEEGDLVISASASMGTVSEVGPESVGSIPYTGLIRLWPNPDRSTKDFIRAIVVSDLFAKQIDVLKAGATIQHFGPTHLRQIRIALPPLDEQQAIASFLDVETSKIDALVSEQRRLIELLQEKRQAVISHAVTKGLNPNVPMKPSGIEWLGDVPEHWKNGRLSHLIDTRKGVAFKADDFTDQGVDVVKASDIKELTIRTPSTFLPSAFVSEYPKAVLNANELVLSTVGSTPEVRNSAVGQLGRVPDSLAGSLLNQNTVVFSPNEEILANSFLYYLIQTTGYRDHLDLHAHGAANQASLNVSDMLRVQIPLPAPTEQAEIAGYLDRNMSLMDALSAEAERAIALLQERRTALISAAVTGKIDVREFALEAAV